VIIGTGVVNNELEIPLDAPLRRVLAQAENLEVPPEILIADDVFNAYTAIKQYGRWKHQYGIEASEASREYRRQALREILTKLEVDIAMLRELIDGPQEG
jgi:hypothetical protein